MYGDLKDKTLICEECGKEFVFPGTIKVENLKLEIKELKEVKKLIKQRDSIEKIIEKTRKNKTNYKIIFLERLLNYYETKILEHSDFFNQEAYAFFGFCTGTTKCKECTMGRKEEVKGLEKS